MTGRISKHLVGIMCPLWKTADTARTYIYNPTAFCCADATTYAHFLFNAFDMDRNGSIRFEDFVIGLSVLLRGSVTEKLNWAFNLYDINKDGYVTKEVREQPGICDSAKHITLYLRPLPFRRCWRLWRRSTTWWAGTPTPVCETRRPPNTWTSSSRFPKHTSPKRTSTLWWNVTKYI